MRVVSHDAVDGTPKRLARSLRMRLLIGALAYLAVVAAVIGTAFVGVSALDRAPSSPGATAGMRAADDAQVRPRRLIADMPVDPNRTPVWIAATAKYQYTPVAVEPRPRQAPVIGRDTRAATARATTATGRDGQLAIRRALREGAAQTGPALGFAATRRDNDPFHRD